MRSDTSTTPVASPDPELVPNIASGPASDQPPVAAPNDTARAREAAATTNGTETRAEHFRRKALRGRLHGYAIAAVGAVAVLIALAASNTAQVKVHWLIGSSHISPVCLLLVTQTVGWVA